MVICSIYEDSIHRTKREYLQKFGGVERHVEEVAKRMAKKGHDVFVYVRNNYTSKDIIEYEGVKLIHLPSIGTKHLMLLVTLFSPAFMLFFANTTQFISMLLGQALGLDCAFFQTQNTCRFNFSLPRLFPSKMGSFGASIFTIR